MTKATKPTKAQEDWAKKKAENKQFTESSRFLKTMLSKATFAEKVQAIEEVNPYFYLLTPKPYPPTRSKGE